MITQPQRAALRRLAGKRSKADLAALFALIRANDDAALFRALASKARGGKSRHRDALLAEIDTILKPVMARSPEKAELLLEHFGQNGAPRGLSAALKQLRAAKLTDAQIREGAQSLVASLSRRSAGKETVV